MRKFHFHLSGGPSLVSFDPASTSYTKTEGDKLTIHCKSSCNPRCSFTWTKQGQNKTVSTNGTLYFDGIQASDAGNYTCLVRNTYNGTTITKSGTITLGVRCK